MAELEHHSSPANLFLQQEVYRLGSTPGLNSLPPGSERDFVLLTWGPIVYRTTYAPETKSLLPIFLRCLNDTISRSLRGTLPGSDEQLRLLQKTYASKVFSSQGMYDELDEHGVRDAFHDFKVSLAIPATELPTRLRACLMVDDKVLSHLTREVDMSAMVEKDADVGHCWVKVIEENFPDSRFDYQLYITEGKLNGTLSAGNYQGWTMVALSALVEVFDGLRQMKSLVEYHREGQVYLGEGQWRSL